MSEVCIGCGRGDVNLVEHLAALTMFGSCQFDLVDHERADPAQQAEDDQPAERIPTQRGGPNDAD